MRSGAWAPLVTLLVTGAGSATVQHPARPEVPSAEAPRRGRAFYFTRAAYSDFRGGWRSSWTTDYPKADIQFLIGVRRLTGIDAYEGENPVRLDDPGLRGFPFVYAVEVGHMALTPPEVAGLRSYLLQGGFLMVDDFWGTYEWANFEQQMNVVLPEYPIVELSPDHPLLRTFYTIDTILQVPNHANGRNGGPTWERDGYVPHLRAIFDERGRLLVLISWNSDLGDAWEWADDPYYPIRFGNFAYRVGINAIVYAMSR